MRIMLRGAFIVPLLAIVMLSFPGNVRAQTETKTEKTEQEKQEIQRRTEAVGLLNTLASLLSARREQLAAIEQLKLELQGAKEDATKKELEEEIKDANAKLEQSDQQITALSTGVSAAEESDEQGKKFDLQAELADLAQPFIRMMKDATENARTVERLRRTIAIAADRHEEANIAVERLNLLLRVQKDNSGFQQTDPQPYLSQLLIEWNKKQKAAVDMRKAANQELAVQLDQQANSQGGLGTFASEFFRNRGLNLLMATTAVIGVFIVMSLVRRAAGWLQASQGIRRSFVTRLISLLFRLTTVIVAFLAMLAVFNAFNDWLLLGVATVFALATAWVGFKMLPRIVEQITLLLNLGAVQEGERVLFAGVPFRVQRLDFYTDLVNPQLDGGSFTMPVRELIGLHSRPAAAEEAWFPTNKGDWVQLADEQVGQVISQTPELVQIRELGGATLTYETAAFLAVVARNLSSGFRMKTEFGLDYRHQHEATTEIPKLLRAFVHDGLTELLGRDGIVHVDVDLLRTADSAIVYEVEADFPGNQAPRYEDIEREIAALLIDACNKYGWVIPFPQIVMHRASSNRAG